MMAPVLNVFRKRSVAEMQTTEVAVAEYSDTQYLREVLQADDRKTEAQIQDALEREAESLGITLPRPATAKTEHNIADSALTVSSHHARTASSGSDDSSSTGITSRSSNDIDTSWPPSRKRRSLSFSEYAKYLAQTEAQERSALGFVPPAAPTEPTPSLFSVSTRKSYASIKQGIKTRLRFRRNNSSIENLASCICCRDEFKHRSSLQTLPCGHNYCEACLRVLITQATNDEQKMPPRCCTQPIPSTIIKSILHREEQTIFMKSVLQFSTPWEARIFCPNPICGEFIPRRTKLDLKHPFEVVCRKCRTRACSTCKRAAHAFGQDCPADWELDAVLQMGEKSGWRRCYKCRTLVELTQGCSHITCRCKAQFCYICGAVWDPMVGCPNYCNGEEELERRRLEEEARLAELEKEKAEREARELAEAAENAEAERRTESSKELNELRARQINERDRFCSFERKMKWMMWTRHGQLKLDVLDRYGEMLTKMKERHTRTATHLEDRQVAAEMELRASHKQAARSVKIRLRHMEAYCDGLGRNASGPNPARVVTERDLRELGQQYNLRDDMERLHQSKINVMRDKQAKQMEQLLARQEEELEKLGAKQDEELESLEESFVSEEDGFYNLFKIRRSRLRRIWLINEEIARKRLENKNGVKFAPMEQIEWPDEEPVQDEGLQAVDE